MAPSLAWFVLGLFLLSLELMNPSAIIFFFGFGAWTVAVLEPWLTMSTSWQLVIFLISSLIYLALLRNTVVHYIESKLASDGEALQDDFIGKTAIVTTEIKPPLAGKVMINGTNWNAISTTSVKEGQPVMITARDNLTLTVELMSNS
jgi:membrane protein implicated in regulation of membrane protease activity